VAHVDEITRLKATIAEQAALVAELEDAVESNESRATSAGSEAATLRETAKGLAEADRTRRSRLAELEGKLLRLEHERKVAAEDADSAGNAERERRLRELEAERDRLRARLGQLEASLGNPSPAVAEAPAATNGHDREAAKPREARQAGDSADVGLLENRLGNYRERAARLREDLEAIRRRLDGLSSSEISGFLEELGEDLAELER
jgi:chromosome segregation ATPase